MQLPHHHKFHSPNQPERGQALVEYVLIVVLVAFIFGVALAATGGVVGNVFSNSINDLLRLTGTPVGGIPDREEFWKTVTYAAENPQQEFVIPTNTKGPPTLTPTDGPSPTFTPVVPTNTHTATFTPTLTPTATDRLFDMPFYDSIEAQNVAQWRADRNTHTSGSPWMLHFFDGAGNPLSPDPIPNPNPPPGQSGGWLRIDFTGDGTLPWMTGVPAQNFSVKLTRDIQLAGKTTLSVRMLLKGRGKVNIGGTDVIAEQNVTGDAEWFTGSIEVNGDGYNGNTTIRTPVTVNYTNAGGPSRLYIWIQAASANPDDTYVNDGGTPGAGRFDCGYGQTFAIKGNDANTELGMWDAYSGTITLSNTDNPTVQDNFNQPPNSRCHLELRGGVKFPATMVRPMLTFWNTWDLPTNVSASLQVANYEQATEPLPGGTPAPVPSLNRAAVNWINIPLHAGGTRNYNWTRHVIDLNKLPGGATLNFSKPLTFRFVIQNTNSPSNVPNRWYIDDVRVEDAGPEKTFALNQPVWRLDNETEMQDFVFTGGRSTLGTISGWRLTSINKLGPTGMSFHDSVGPNDKALGSPDFTNYKRHTQSRQNSTDARDMRINSLEFNGWIQLQGAPLVDADGNRGVPVLAFYHAFLLGGNTGLEVQWTADDFSVATPNWRTFADGLIRSTTDASTTPTTDTTLKERVVMLRDLEGNPPRIRIRFAMKVPHNAGRADGWWIDNIRLGREETPRWIDYPFYDDAQQLTGLPWRFNGTWTQTGRDGRRNADEPLETTYKRMSYASSPGGKHPTNTRTAMEGRFALDLRDDTHNDTTQEKLIWGRPDPKCPNNAQTCNPPPPPPNRRNTGGAAVNPVLSFYHWRDLGNSTHIEVQWKRLDGAANTWQTLWIYENGMSTAAGVKNTETAIQKAWEYVEISLTDVMAAVATNDPATFREDDVIFRFVLDSKGTTAGEGLFIDDIRIFERPNSNAAPLVFNLWSPSEVRQDPANGNAPIGNGNGTDFFDDPDASTTNLFWEQSWFNGGNWHAVNWESRVGMLSFHDSPLNGQENSPDGEDNYIGETGWFVPLDTFNVLELNHIIDLRPVNAVTEAPALFFWNRYHLGGGNIAAVQISTEMVKADGTPYLNNTTDQAALDANIKTRCTSTIYPTAKQCYEQRRGWTAWETVWERKVNTGSEERAYGWEREQVNLSRFAYNPANPIATRFGKRIRIRFVLNQLANTNNNKDGWYIDQVTIQHTRPPDVPDQKVIDQAYVGNPSKPFEWTMEGNWGLDSLIFDGTGGAPVVFGTWQTRWWNCATCSNEPGANNSFRNGAMLFLEKPTRPAPDYAASTLSINFNMGNGRPLGAPATFPTDRFVGEMVLNTPIVGTSGVTAGEKTLVVTADDGVRVRVDEITGGTVLPVKSWAECVDNWQEQAPTTSSCNFRFDQGKQYRITIYYFDATQGAVLVATIGEGKFSFSDSPAVGGPAALDKAPLAFANTSMRLNRILDLTGIPTNAVPLMFYKTKYRLGPKTTGRVEVSIDGGFSWDDNAPLGNTLPGYPFVSPNITNRVVDPNTTAIPWETRWHNLSNYRNTRILIRFRLDRQLESCARSIRSNTNSSQPDSAATECNPQTAGGQAAVRGFFDGWWISEVTIDAQ